MHGASNLNISVETHCKPSSCCECGNENDAASGPCQPSPGDFSLCIACGSLNVFDNDLSLRSPVDDEIFEAAKSSEVQLLRRAILATAKALA